MEGVGHKLFYPIRSGKAGIVKFPKTFYFPFLSSGHLYPSRLYSLPSSNFLWSPLGVVVDVFLLDVVMVAASIPSALLAVCWLYFSVSLSLVRCVLVCNVPKTHQIKSCAKIVSRR